MGGAVLATTCRHNLHLIVYLNVDHRSVALTPMTSDSLCARATAHHCHVKLAHTPSALCAGKIEPRIAEDSYRGLNYQNRVTGA